MISISIVDDEKALRESIATFVNGSQGFRCISTYGSAGSHATTTYWIYLAIFAVVFFAAAWITLARSLTRRS